MRYVSLPLQRLAGLARGGEPLVILDSASPGPQHRYSYIFRDPLAVLRADSPEELPALWRALEHWQSRAWLAGYLTYEAAYSLEPRLVRYARRGGAPLAWFVVCDAPTVFDHVTARFAPALRLSRQAEEQPLAKELGGEVVWEPEISRHDYFDRVAQVRELIAAGEIYQLNLTYRTVVRTSLDDVALYRRLRHEQAVQYAAYVQHDGAAMVSLSPELFFALDGRQITVKPMKGTSDRGRTAEEDLEKQARLASDPKNQAENLMIVDLLRNDLGKLCQAGSVDVRELFAVEQHRTVLQMTSTITGRLRARHSLAEIFAALFPSGSVTGAPKLRAMEVIAQLEDGPRGLYCGALGFSSPRGQAVFSVPIRTLTRTAGERCWHYGVGSGVVWESDAATEWQECQTKTAFLGGMGGAFSLVETVYYDGSPGFSSAHLERLTRSAQFWGIAFSRRDWQTAFAEIRAAVAGEPPVIVRLVLDGQGRLSWRASALPAAEWPSLPAPIWLERLPVAQTTPFLFHKTTHCPWYSGARAAIQRGEVFDVVFINRHGEITEGARSTLFALVEGELVTPPLRCGLLPGVLRGALVAAGQCRERVLGERDLIRADRLFCGNAVRGLVPVRLVEPAARDVCYDSGCAVSFTADATHPLAQVRRAAAARPGERRRCPGRAAGE